MEIVRGLGNGFRGIVTRVPHAVQRVVGQSDMDSRSCSVLEALHGHTDEIAAQVHNPKLYEKAFATRLGRQFKAKKYLDCGRQAVAIELEGDKVLKIINPWFRDPLPGDAGQRPFDAPILQEGEIPLSDFSPYRHTIHYIIQPKVKMDATSEDLDKFGSELNRLGYRFHDEHTGQIGHYRGRLVLIDYDCAQKHTGV